MANDMNRPPKKPGGFRPSGTKTLGTGAYGKPANGRDSVKPAGEQRYGRPVNEQGFAKPAGERRYGKPASGQAITKPDRERRYGRPANGQEFSRPTGERRFSRPSDGKPSNTPVKRPAPTANVPTTNARRVALDVLLDVLQGGAYASLALDERLKNGSLTQTDKRFCTSIVYKTLENLIRIDYVLSKFLEDAESLEIRVRVILRMGACQILFHDRIPDNAVVDEAVKLTRAIGLEAFTGLTNAVLRNLLRGESDIRYPTSDEGARYLSIMYSVPEWLAQRLINAYGAPLAREICAYRTQSHFTCVRPNLMRVSDDEFEKILQKKVWKAEKSDVPHAWRVREASDIARDADYIAGHFSIQSESSMMAAEALCLKKGMQVLDCCAAPGGKSAYIAESMQGTGRVYAWDIHDHRVALIRALMRRLRIENIRPAIRDAAILKEDQIGTLDAVLLDAPCSGLGVMDDKPDVKYRVTEESVKELTALQEKLLDTCCQYVKMSGTFVYSTCSILPDENERQIKAFLERHPEFVIAPLPDTILPRFREQAGEYGLQLLPSRDHVEGFFIARMVRKG